MINTLQAPAHPSSSGSFMDKLNGVWHERALAVFMIIVLAHWAEHLVQAFQIFGLGMARPDSRGVIGQVFPWVVKSEALHYGYAIVMLAGLWLLRKGFTGRSHTWWMVAFWIQAWHHIEHFLLQGQAIVGQNLWGSPVPTSVVQSMFPTMRVELHLFYNTIVFVPMIIAMVYHMYPPKSEANLPVTCTCARHSRASA
jgi:hypothetical protein